MPDTSARRSRSASARRARAATVRDHLELWAVRAVAGLAGLLGVDRASATMGWLWRMLAPLNPRHARAAMHLAIAMPEIPAAGRRRILAEMWDNLGRTAAEALLLPSLIAARDRFEVAADLDPATREAMRNGAIFASLHQGNWEIVAWGIRLSGLSTAAVYRPLKNPLVDAWLRQRRIGIYDAGLYGRESATALRLRSLARAGTAVGMVADLRDQTGIEVPFFGRPAPANALPVMLARRLGLPLIAGRALRTGGARFRIEAVRVEVPRTDDVAADIAAGTAALTARFEDWIRNAPGQWMWAHRKWRKDVVRSGETSTSG